MNEKNAPKSTNFFRNYTKFREVLLSLSGITEVFFKFITSDEVNEQHKVV